MANIKVDKKKVLVTGVTGQDGSFMVDYLLKNTNHIIFGAVRRLSVKNHRNIDHVDNERFTLIDMDVSDPLSVSGVIADIKPDYFINFAANSFVGSSWEMPTNHFATNTMGVLYQLDAIRNHCPKCRYYNAGSSEEFGDVMYSPQDEKHPLRPRSPYGASKAAARHIVKVYRESYGLYAVQGWLFNHESERRGEEFVTRKITKAIATMKINLKYGVEPTTLMLGNLNAKRDWSHAKDFVRGVWKMLNQDTYRLIPLIGFTDERSKTEWLAKEFIRDYVLSSNETHSVREFVDAAMEWAGIEGEWVGKGLDERYVLENYTLVAIDPQFYRPAEVELLYGDSTRAREEMGWEQAYDFNDLVNIMLENDLKDV